MDSLSVFWFPYSACVSVGDSILQVRGRLSEILSHAPPDTDMVFLEYCFESCQDLVYNAAFPHLARVRRDSFMCDMKHASDMPHSYLSHASFIVWPSPGNINVFYHTTSFQHTHTYMHACTHPLTHPFRHACTRMKARTHAHTHV